MSNSYCACEAVKIYSGVTVLHGVDFKIEQGSIHGLFGHNGAGKSTLLKLMAGVENLSGGELKLFGETLSLDSPQKALHHGIACVYQELRLLSNLTVIENVFLGREIAVKFGIKDDKSMFLHTKRLLDEYGIKVSPRDYVKDLTHPVKQMIEVVINLDRNAKFIFLDEPTTAIESKQADILLKDIQRIVKEKNIGVAIVSHKIDEVLKYCDEVSVMSGGKMVFHAKRGKFSKQDIISSIVGNKNEERKISINIAENIGDKSGVKENLKGKPFMDIKNLSTLKLKNINMKAYRGEVLGIYGLVGSGRTSFCYTLYGIHKTDSGEILLDGKNYIPKSPRHAMKSGISYLTEDRKNLGIIPFMSAIRNTSITSLERFGNSLYLNYKNLDRETIAILRKMQIKGDIYSSIKSLSGGNQQKAILARIIEEKSTLLLLDEPTKGVDLGAKSDIYNIIRSLVKLGHCVIIVSSEEEELVEIADKVITFKAGSCRENILEGADITVTNLRESVF